MKKTVTIYGLRPVIEAINSGKEIDKILVHKELKGELARELFSLARNLDIPIQYVPLEKLNKITSGNHQGIIAFISPVVYQHIENILPVIYEQGENPMIIILDRITDVRNLGGILRTAECAGIHAVIIPSKGSAQINADTVKTSAGAVHKINICRHQNLKSVINYLKESGLCIIAATEKADLTYDKAVYNVPLAIILGSEESGISAEYLRLADSQVRIPVKGDISSLNVSVAAGILIYEILKQRDF